MRILVLNSTGRGWHVDDLRRAAEARGHQLAAMSWRTLVAGVAIASPSPFDDADLVLLRNMPPGSLEQIVFRMDLLANVAASGQCVVNPPRTIEIAVDKYLALSRMAAAGLPVPKTIVCQRAADAMIAFDQLGDDAVIKPLFGAEGAGITRVSDPALAQRAFGMLEHLGSIIYLQQFIDHGGSDLRLFVLDGQVIAAMRRISDDWRTNIARGGHGERFAPDAALCDLAVRAARTCETVIAGVDIVIDRREQPFLLEINAVPGWQALSQVSGVDIAGAIMDKLASHDRRTSIATGVRMGSARAQGG